MVQIEVNVHEEVMEYVLAHFNLDNKVIEASLIGVIGEHYEKYENF